MSRAVRSLGIGIDVGGTSTRVVVFDADDRALHHDVAPTALGPTALLDDLARRVDDAIAVVPERPISIGVGIPGGVRSGVVTMALNVGIDGRLDLARELEARVGLPVHVENDVNAAALGACTALTDIGSSLTYLSIGTGIAAGTVIDGHIVRGRSGVAGEIGHVPLPGRTEPCVCGQAGCVEAVASGRSVVAMMRTAGLDGGVVELFDAADHDSTAAAIRDDMVAALAWSAQLAVLINDVEAVVLGGGVALALGDRLGDAVRDLLTEREERAPFLAALGLAARVRVAPDGVEFGALGAHRAAVDAAVEVAT